MVGPTIHMDNGHYYAVTTALKHNKCNSLITVNATSYGLYSVQLVLAQNFHSKANPAIDAAASSQNRALAIA